MRTTCPATGAAHAFAHFIETNSDATFSRLRFFRVFHPANPLVSREWRDIEPQYPRFFVGLDGSTKVLW